MNHFIISQEHVCSYEFYHTFTEITFSFVLMRQEFSYSQYVAVANPLCSCYSLHSGSRSETERKIYWFCQSISYCLLMIGYLHRFAVGWASLAQWPHFYCRVLETLLHFFELFCCPWFFFYWFGCLVLFLFVFLFRSPCLVGDRHIIIYVLLNVKHFLSNFFKGKSLSIDLEVKKKSRTFF